VGEAVNPTAWADMIDRWADVWFGFVLGLGAATIFNVAFTWIFLGRGR
jgi:hypothetical protein